MPIEKLRENLTLLREEIARADDGDRDALAGLEQLSREVERELEQERALSDPAGLAHLFETGLGPLPNLLLHAHRVIVPPASGWMPPNDGPGMPRRARW